MKPGTVKREDWKQALKRVGDNLYRSDATEIYYAIFKRNGKQIPKLDLLDGPRVGDGCSPTASTGRLSFLVIPATNRLLAAFGTGIEVSPD